jgi:hypothetical protein
MSKKIKMLRLAKQLNKKGSLVICDRFPQKDIRGMFDGPKLPIEKNGWWAQLEMKQFSKLCRSEADLVFRLTISPAIAARRKPSHDHTMIAQKCSHLFRLAFGTAMVFDVDAEQPYEQVLLDVKRKIWKNL